jgi:hypothetical protein
MNTNPHIPKDNAAQRKYKVLLGIIGLEQCNGTAKKKNMWCYFKPCCEGFATKLKNVA